MSRYAVISDIHGNLPALEEVLSRLSGLGVDEVICLGDVVGYGPAPDACVDLIVRHCSVAIRGNHDQAVVDLRLGSTFNGAAQQALLWTQSVLGPLHLSALNRFRDVAYVGDRVMCVHDNPVPGPTDYIHDRVIAAEAFAGVDRQICLVGHTHVPVVFEAPAAANAPDTPAFPALGFDVGVDPLEVTAYLPSDGVPISLDPEKRYICNPGSVGQPRDADPRASFAVLDLEKNTFTVHRQEYDIVAVQMETQRAGLPLILAERLAIGA
jgi:predicted phosphodiesterase